MCEPGTLVWTCPRYAHVISSASISSVCDACLAAPNTFDNTEPVTLLRCSRCKLSYYCGRACQKAGWREHQTECRYLQRVAPRTPPPLVRLLLRVATRHAREPNYREKLAGGGSRGLDDLVSHETEIRAGERGEAWPSLLAVARACSGEQFSGLQLWNLYCKLLINSCEITDQQGGVVGTGLYLALTALDHSCRATVSVVFTAAGAELRALAALPALAWGAARLDYLSCVLPGPARRARLQDQYYFTCTCHTCTCPATWEVEDSEMASKAEPLLAACLERGEFKQFYRLGQQLLQVYRRHFPGHSPAVGLHLAKLAKTALHLGHTEPGLEFLQQSLAAVRVSHGQTSPLFQYLLALRDTAL